MKWISVKDRLPEIPEGKYGIGVLVAEFDAVYKESCGGDGYTVHEVDYSYTEGHEMYKGSKGDKDFMTIYFGGDSGAEWGPTGDVVTHWMYLPAPPNQD